MEELDSLYSVKLKDIPLARVEERLQKYHRVLTQELAAKGLKVQFHMWVSDEWFCPDGVPGFALPFYLFNPNVAKIHKQEMGFIEGKNEKEILKLLRHELGHAIDNAFALRKLRDKMEVFGSSKQEYPDYYQPKKHSRNYINYLGDNYAQAHPDEDFAECFAYWLDPDKKEWPQTRGAMLDQKIAAFTELMKHVKKSEQVLTNRWIIDPVRICRKTVREFYRWRKYDITRKHYQIHSQGLGSSAGNPRILPNFRKSETTLIEKNFRYLVKTDQLKYYL